MYKLLRELGNVKGIAAMVILCLGAFIEAIRQLKCSREEFDSLYMELSEIVKNSQPGIIPLTHLLEYFELDMQQRLKPEMTMETVRKISIQSLEDKISRFKRNAAQVKKNGLAYVRNRDVIVVHSASTVVTNILVHAKEKLDRQFKVIVLDLCTERTQQTVQALRRVGIEHTIIPAHNLSHHIEGATKMFVGAMTITSNRKIVAPVGTAGTVSLCRLNGIKVHLFANTLHYSHQNSARQNIFQVQEEANIGTTEFSLNTHSHDLVCLSFIDHIVTEIGEVSEEGLLIAAPVSVPLSRDTVREDQSISVTVRGLPEISLA